MLGPLAWLGYRRWGRPASPACQEATGAQADYGERMSVGIGVSHCGAGCTLGDIIGASLVFGAGWELLGLALPVEYIVDPRWRSSWESPFSYFSIVPMRGLGVRDGIVAALKADALSLTAFEIGLFGWMALTNAVCHGAAEHIDVTL